MTEKKYDGLSMIGIFLLGILLGLVIMGLVWASLSQKEYDQDCLDNLANKICIEEGYERGEDVRTWGNEFICYPVSRKSTKEILNWLEGEKETCKK